MITQQTISIYKVLEVMKLCIPGTKPFSVSARYTTGKNKGKIYQKNNCFWHLSEKYRNDRGVNKKLKKSKSDSIFFQNDNIRLFDVEADRPFSMVWWTIIKFNGRRVIYE